MLVRELAREIVPALKPVVGVGMRSKSSGISPFRKQPGDCTQTIEASSLRGKSCDAARERQCQ